MKVFVLICLSLLYFSAGQEMNCVDNPTLQECSSYEYPVSNSTQDMNSLCKSMPYMSGCSIRIACEDNHDHHGTTYCDPFSLVADVCYNDMPGMSGCKSYVKLCKTEGSVIEQCEEFPPIPNLPTTVFIDSAVKSMCGQHYMPGCEQCPLSSAGFMDCDILKAYSTICQSMPDMTECQQWKSMCESIPDWPEFCISSQSPPLMRMYFHVGIVDYILFKGWVARTDLQYIGSMLACVLLAVIFEAFQVLRVYLEWKWGLVDSEKLPTNNENDSKISTDYKVEKFRWKVDLPRSILHTVEIALGYLLMLIAMTFNLGLFLAVLVGFMIGNLSFGRYKKYSPSASCCS